MWKCRSDIAAVSPLPGMGKMGRRGTWERKERLLSISYEQHVRQGEKTRHRDDIWELASAVDLERKPGTVL